MSELIICIGGELDYRHDDKRLKFKSDFSDDDPVVQLDICKGGDTEAALLTDDKEYLIDMLIDKREAYALYNYLKSVFNF